MLIFRFMSRSEYDKYQSGAELVNRTRHYKCHRTTSSGFCFFPVPQKGGLTTPSKAIRRISAYKPSEAILFLSGIVSADMVCVFEIEDIKQANLRVTHAKYAVPYEWNPDAGWCDTFGTTELCTKKYSKATMRLVYAKPVPEWWF